MADPGRILVADDEETFLYSTADLLRREGYECDCVSDGIAAADALRSGCYDLLIADIKMPGNPQLELIRDLPRIAEGMPVVLVTGYPSIKSAIQSIQLPVAAYMVKPIDFGELLAQVQASIERFQIYRTICSVRQGLQKWHKDLEAIEEVLTGKSEGGSSAAMDAFFELTFQNIVGALLDMKHLAEAMAARNADQESLEPCHLLNCPKLNVLSDALVETISVLEKTKNAFKSKDLGRLRQKLEGISSSVLE
jgi:CheY-like chemotaxis protein